MYWSIAQCHTQREVTADKFLKRKGFETYLPKIREPVGPTGARRIVPLFPGYLFVRIVVAWYPILSTVGVLRLLRTGDEPCKVDDQLVSKIQRQEVRGIVRLPESGLKRGDHVRVTRGSFRDHIGIFEGMHGKQRSKILLELLGREVPVTIAVADFVALEATTN